ncbi:hypothetical protein AB0M28_07840 [Streptomyces sp. NPDC051940]|uniref:LolA family protein n=1 Tax=Streptomyces sp. NPDC051940 TaxID=3155675 RepID=UPI00343F7116
MAQIRPEQPVDVEPPERPRKALRYGVPLGIAGVTALTIGLVPALAQTGDGLDDISAEDLITKVLESDVETVQGTVKVQTDLGLPALPAGLGGDKGSSADPTENLTSLLSGESKLQVAADGPDKQKVTLVGKGGKDYTVLHSGDDLWAYGAGSDEVFHGTGVDAAAADAEKKDGGEHGLPDDLADLSPRELAQEALERTADTSSVTVAGTTSVAGQDAYQLRIAPKQDASTVKDIRIAVAETGVPLKFTLTTDDNTKVLDVGFTQVDFAKPDAGTFAYKPPAGAQVTEKDLGEREAAPDKGQAPAWAKDVETHGSGWTTVGEISLPAGALDEDGAGMMLDTFTEKADGGRLFSTPLVNALVTDDGKVFFGAVDADELSKVAAEN